MEYLNNDMDDMFRQSADKYPLKNEGADWSSIEKRLQAASDEDAAVAAKNGETKRRRALWLFLLLLISSSAGVGYIVYFKQDKNKVVAVDQNGQNYNQLAITSNNNNNIIDGKTIAATDNSNNNNNLVDKIAQANNNDSNSSTQNSIAAIFPAVDGKNKTRVPNNPIVIHRKGKMRASITNGDAENDSLSTSNIKDIRETNETEDATAMTTSSSNLNNKTGNKKPQPVVASTSQAPAKEKATADAKKDTTKLNTAAKKNTETTHHKGLYVGVLVGPDISTVKFQSIKGVGYEFGLLVGYRFTKTVFFETGLLWDKKNYYSEGQYFNKEKTGIPAYTKIINVNGNCGMFEFPLNIRYDIATHSKSSFFSVAGLSSYFMKNENYNYLANTGGTVYSSSGSYKNSANNWLSVINVSAGYEHQIKNVGNVRIEPYIKIPISGMGIGSLPIASAGIYLGITRDIR